MTAWRPTANPVQNLPKGILGSEVSRGRQVTSHLQYRINRLSHKLVQLPANSSALPTWQQPVLISSCADSDTSPLFQAAQGMPGLSSAHSWSDFSWLPWLWPSSPVLSSCGTLGKDRITANLASWACCCNSSCELCCLLTIVKFSLLWFHPRVGGEEEPLQEDSVWLQSLNKLYFSRGGALIQRGFALVTAERQ